MPRPTRAQALIGLLAVLAAALAFDRVIAPDGAEHEMYQAAFLPPDLHLCGRDWSRSDVRDVRTLDAIRQLAGIQPVVDPRPFAPCPPGPCRNVDTGACHTVIYVRVAQDGYVAYELRGGP